MVALCSIIAFPRTDAVTPDTHSDVPLAEMTLRGNGIDATTPHPQAQVIAGRNVTIGPTQPRATGPICATSLGGNVAHSYQHDSGRDSVR